MTWYLRCIQLVGGSQQMKNMVAIAIAAGLDAGIRICSSTWIVDTREMALLL